MKRDITSDLHYTPAMVPGSGTGVSATLDMQGSIGACLVMLLGAVTVAGVVTLYEGNASDMSDETAVADADLNGTETLAGWSATDDGKVRKLGYVGNKRYIRGKFAPTTDGALVAAVWVTKPEQTPAPNPPA